VERDIAAAITLENFHTALRQQLGGCHDIFLLGVAAQSDHGSVFEQQQYIADTVFLTQFHQPLLQAQASGVI
jgi:hypothetical protein